MNAREHVNLLILLVQQILQLSYFSFQTSNAIFQGLCVPSWKCSATQLVAGFAFEADIGTLGTAWSNAVTPDLLAPTPIAGLCNPTLGTAPHSNHLHR